MTGGGAHKRCGDGSAIEVDETLKIFDKLQKQELIRLQRKYRQLGGDTHGSEHDGGGKAGRQREMARQLIYEKENLRADLAIANSARNKKIALLTSEEVDKVLQRYDDYRHGMEENLDEVQDIEHQLDKIIRRILQQKIKILKAYDQLQSLESTCKLIGNCRTRLCVLTRYYNTRCYINHKMRGEVAEYLLTRTRFFYRQKWYRDAYQEVISDLYNI